MDDKTSNAGVSAEQQTVPSNEKAADVQSAGPSAERAGAEPRRAYGTAKTENLRDSEIWRFLLPAVVILCCLALLAIPLIILITLLIMSLDPHSPTSPLIWVWITMIVIVLVPVAIIARGLLKIFMTQAVNYER